MHIIYIFACHIKLYILYNYIFNIPLPSSWPCSKYPSGTPRPTAAPPPAAADDDALLGLSPVVGADCLLSSA